MQDHLSKYYSSKAINLYMVALLVCNIIFFNRVLGILWWIFGIAEVVLFFNFANQMTRKWTKLSVKKFPKKVFQTAFVIRLVWVVFSYFFYTIMTGKPFEFDAADSLGYHNSAQHVASMINSGQLQHFFDSMRDNYSDMGYPLFLGIEYWILGNSIFLTRIIKALIGAYTCVLIYKLTVRTFGEEIGRMATIFCVLMPNLIYYCGIHTKEVEMVFITVAFMERADLMFRNKNFNFIEIAPPLLLAVFMFFFRTVLGATAIFALFTTLIFSSTKVLGMGKRIVLIVWILGALSYFVGGKVSNEVEKTWSERKDNQSASMEFRSVRVNGNKFSKYASGAVFAPLIFIIPFPTVIETPQQENQKMINGGNYVKNIMAFFVVFALFWIIKNKKWNENVLMGSFLIGYLIVLALSAFAQSERFHQPVLPFELIFSALGVSLITKKDNKYFTWYMGLLFVIMIGWSWFKLAGRGLV